MTGRRRPQDVFVFAELLSVFDECRMYIRGDGVDLLWKFSQQPGKKRGRVFRRSCSHLPVSVLGDFLDGEEDRNAEVAAEQDHTIIGDFKTVGLRQVGAREGQTGARSLSEN